MLVACPSCGKKISDRAPSCPFCKAARAASPPKPRKSESEPRPEEAPAPPPPPVDLPPVASPPEPPPPVEVSVPAVGIDLPAVPEPVPAVAVAEPAATEPVASEAPPERRPPSPSPGLAVAWRVAATEAGAAGYPKIECAHLLMGVLSLDKASPRVLKDLGIEAEALGLVGGEHLAVSRLFSDEGADPKIVRRDLRARVKRKPVRAKGMMSRSAASKAVFAEAEKLAASGSLNSLHLLAALLRDPDPVISSLLVARGLGPRLADKAEAVAAQPFENVVVRRERTASRSKRGLALPKPPANEGKEALARYGRDLTALARSGDLGPVIGREKEVQRVVQSLGRSTPSHPLLIGDAGVGKSAIVAALAILGVAEKEVPPGLLGKRIIELDLGALRADAEYRADPGSRIKALLEEVQAAKDVILFIEKIHTLASAGQKGVDLEISNLLKPAIARGEIKVIGATTAAEFRQDIEKDAALERRFETIDVSEPSVTDTLGILHGLKDRFEKRHGVRIVEAALEAAVSLSVRFDPDRRLPEKSVDLIEKASARAAKGGPGQTVDARVVAEVLAETRGLPIESVTDSKGEGARLLKLEAHLKSRIIGQDEAVAKVAARIRLARAGHSERPGPLAVFMWLGPEGVGKSEMARTLAKFLFGGPDDLLRFDLSEYADEPGVARLIGVHGDAHNDTPGLLPEAIRAKPAAVLLLDEVDKAHPKVFERLLQLFETGSLTDSKGSVADARSAIVIMTSHLGDREMAAKAGLASAPNETMPLNKEGKAKADLRRFFRPEFLNRVDDVITFRSLDEGDVSRIARPLLAALTTRVRKTHGVFLRFESDAEAFVIRSGFDAEKGVRELKRVIDRLVETPVASLAQAGKLAQHPAWKAVYDEGGLYFLPE